MEKLYICNRKFLTKGMTLVSSKEFLEPDEDFYRALPAEEFRKKLVVVLENINTQAKTSNSFTRRNNISHSLHRE